MLRLGTSTSSAATTSAAGAGSIDGRLRMRVREVADVVAGLFTVVRRSPFGRDIGENFLPVLDERRRVAVDFEPRQRVRKHAPIHQRSLYSRMCAEIVQAALQHQDLAQSFDVAARE